MLGGKAAVVVREALRAERRLQERVRRPSNEWATRRSLARRLCVAGVALSQQPIMTGGGREGRKLEFVVNLSRIQVVDRDGEEEYEGVGFLGTR